MMRQIAKLLFLSLIVVQVSCVQKSSDSAKEDSSIIETADTSSVPDTIRQTVIVVDTIKVEKEDVKVASDNKPTQASTTTSSQTKPTGTTGGRDDGRIDNSNSGFFDQYKETYTGDPNKDLKPIVKVIEEKGPSDEKKELERQLNQLEQLNKEQKDTQKRINEEIEEYNKKEVEKAKETTGRETEKAKGKTLDTDLLNKK